MKYLRRILVVLVLLVAANGALALMMLGSTPLGGLCVCEPASHSQNRAYQTH